MSNILAFNYDFSSRLEFLAVFALLSAPLPRDNVVFAYNFFACHTAVSAFCTTLFFISGDFFTQIMPHGSYVPPFCKASPRCCARRDIKIIEHMYVGVIK